MKINLVRFQLAIQVIMIVGFGFQPGDMGKTRVEIASLTSQANENVLADPAFQDAIEIGDDGKPLTSAVDAILLSQLDADESRAFENQQAIVASQQVYTPIRIGLIAVLALLIAIFGAPLISRMMGTPSVTSSIEESTDVSKVQGAGKLYVSLLDQLLKAPIFMIGLTLAVLASLLGLYMSKDRGSEFFPSVEASSANLIISSRGDFSLEENNALVAEVERRVIEVQSRNREFYSAQANVNSTSTNGDDTIGNISLVFTDYFLRDRLVDDIMAELREVSSDLPGIQLEIQPCDLRLALVGSELPQATRGLLVRLHILDLGEEKG